MRAMETPSDEMHKGHRRRLREKFLESGLAGFHDYEIVELLLTLGSPRKDCKPQAKEAIKRFKTLRGVLSASAEELQQIEGVGQHSAFGIRLVQEMAREFLKGKIVDQPFLKSSREIFDYLYHAMRDRKKELFKIVYLNSQNQIIEVADLFEGTVDSSSISPREIIEGALKDSATALIFVHNHPSGNPAPSTSDREMTRQLVYVGKIMQMKIVDHIIIGNDRYYSFADEGLIEEYGMDFLNLRLRGTSESKRRIYQTRLVRDKRA